MDIDLNGRSGTDAREIVEGTIVDFDAERRPVGIENQNACRNLGPLTLETRAVPVRRG